MEVEKELLGKTKDGQEVYCYTMENKHGMRAKVMTFGAILKNLYVTDKNGNVNDVVIGYDRWTKYLTNSSCFGSTIGPIANRTEAGKFKLGKNTYQMQVNDRGLNNLHTDLEEGFHKRVWNAEVNKEGKKRGEQSVTFSLVKKDGEMGHPGTLKVSVTYTLTDKNELKIHYHADTSKKTIINMTNHSYFNLSGQQSKSIEDTSLKLFASNYTPVRADAIPTGEIVSVKGTPMDFTKEKKIGRDIGDEEFEQLAICGGYDHNWVIDGWDGTLRKAAVAKDEKAGLKMEAFTDLPGVQFYAGNYIGKEMGKDGVKNGKRKGFCLETQYYPNCANEKKFPQPIFDKTHSYDTTTVYKFSIIK